MSQMTQLLERTHAEHASAREALLSVPYEQLRRLARRKLRGRGRGTDLETTRLVRKRFLAVAA